MEQAQRGTAGQHQRRTPVGTAGGLEEIEFFAETEFNEIAVAQVVERRVDFIQVTFDQVLGAHLGHGIERGVGNVAEVAVQSFVQVEHQPVDVVTLARVADLGKTQADQFVVIAGGAVVCFPVLGTGEAVVLKSCGAPCLVGEGMVHVAFEGLQRFLHTGSGQAQAKVAAEYGRGVTAFLKSS